MKNLHPYNQTLFVVWGNQILFWLTTFYLFSSSNFLYFIPLIIIAMYTFGCMSEVAVHRFFTHKSYKTTTLKEKILLIFALLVGQGATLSWVAVHRNHHAFEDTPKDPHSPHFIPKWRLVLGLFPKQEFQMNILADLLRSKYKNYFLFENKYYWIMWAGMWIATYFINFYLFYFLVSGSALWYLCTQLVNIGCHGTKGKKAYPNAVGFNSSWINLITGAGHHNNHHGSPKNHSYKFTNEIDIYAWVIEKFFKIS